MRPFKFRRQLSAIQVLADVSQSLFEFVQGVGKIFLVGDGYVTPHRIRRARNAREITQSTPADIEKWSIGAEFINQRGRQRR